MVRGEQQGGRAAPHSHEERGGRASFVDTLTDDPRRAALHVLRDSDWRRVPTGPKKRKEKRNGALPIAALRVGESRY